MRRIFSMQSVLVLFFVDILKIEGLFIQMFIQQMFTISSPCTRCCLRHFGGMQSSRAQLRVSVSLYSKMAIHICNV